MNRVIDTATGVLKRAGFCDFLNDGSFDATTETYFTDVPGPAMVKGSSFNTNMHKWDGSAWVEVTNVINKSRELIYSEILSSAESITQLPRILDALDKYHSITVALDNGDYSLARIRATKARVASDITQADYDLFDSKIPS